MIYTLEPNLGKLEKKYIIKSINKNIVSTYGNNINKFEKKFSTFVGSKYSAALNSGTSALHLGLLANNVRSNELVIVPSYTFAASVNTIIYCGAEPWFHDINPDNMMLDLKQVYFSLKNKTIKKNNSYFHYKTKQKISCILPVMTFGYSIDLKYLKKIKKEFNINVLIDAAAGHFSTYNKKKIGFFDFDCCYSFNGNKNITTSSGGAFCTNNRIKNNYVKNLSKVGRVSKYSYKYVGYNYRMNSLQAALGEAQLQNTKKFLKNKNKIFLAYSEYFENSKLFKKIKIDNFQNLAGWLFAVKINSKILNKIIDFLKKKRIFLTKFWQPIHLQKPYKKFIAEDLKFTVSESKKILCLPSSTFLKRKEIKYILSSFKSFVKTIK